MKALSIKQPWASLIAHGIKDIENRTWKTKFRGTIYIYASAKTAGSTLDLLTPQQWNEWDLHIKKIKYFPCFDFSAIIGEVDIIDCVQDHPSIWAEKAVYNEEDFMDEEDEINYHKNIAPFIKPIYNWVLANAKLYDKPILNVKGKLSFWETDYIHCENCNKPHHCNEMVSNEEAHWFCNSCVEEAKAEKILIL